METYEITITLPLSELNGPAHVAVSEMFLGHMDTGAGFGVIDMHPQFATREFAAQARAEVLATLKAHGVEGKVTEPYIYG